ncbi:hypothetical protein D9M68_444520 [compost metagenome]
MAKKLSYRELRSLLAVVSIVPTLALAQGSYPNRPISWIVPFTPGGVTDTASRTIAKTMSETLGQPVVVENRPGAGGMVGTEVVAHAPADGYTLLYGTQGTMAANLALYRKVRYDPLKDFVPVRAISETSTIMVVNASRPYKTVKEFVAYARQHPEKVNYGSAGSGTGTHLSAQLFQTSAGVKLTHVPYKGSSPAINDLLGGVVDVMFDYPSVLLPHIQSGRLRALATTGKERLALLPNVPTIAESGYSMAQASSWSGLLVPAGTPPQVVARLSQALDKALRDPEVLKSMEPYGSIPLHDLAGQKFGGFIRSEIAKWGEVVKQSGARLD